MLGIAAYARPAASAWALASWSAIWPGASPSGRLLMTLLKPAAAIRAKSSASICGATAKSGVTERISAKEPSGDPKFAIVDTYARRRKGRAGAWRGAPAAVQSIRGTGRYMLQLAARRLLVAIPTMLVIIAAAFFLMHAAPGGPFDREHQLPEDIKKRVEAHFNLDKP